MLLGIKPISLILDMHGLLSFFLSFWTTLEPLVLFLQILLENLLKVLLQIVKGT
jgi:hypothetical protein